MPENSLSGAHKSFLRTAVPLLKVRKLLLYFFSFRRKAMKKLFTITLTFLSALAFAQAPNIEWQHSYGGTGLDQASVVLPTSDGGFIINGLSTSTDGDVTDNHGSADHWVIKTDALGAVVWKRSYGGSSDDKGYDVRETSDGGYVLTGYSVSNDGDVTSTPNGSTEFWIVKLDASGGIQWENTLGGTSAENAYTIRQTFDGGYAIQGLTFTNNSSTTDDVEGAHGSFDFWFCKLDATGNLEWQRPMGGSMTEQGFGMVQCADTSGFVVCGYSQSSNGATGDVTFNNGGNDYWIAKIDNTGTLVWQQSYGGTLSDRCFNIIQTNDGGYMVNGVTASSDGDVVGNHGLLDYWVLKLDDQGTIEWQKALGGTGDDFGRSVQQTIDGGYIIGGKSSSTDGDVTGNHGGFDYWIVKLDPTGNIEWEKSLGGTLDEAPSGSTVPFMNVAQLSDGKYIMVGSTYSTDGDATGNVSIGASDDNYWLVKLWGCPAYLQANDTVCHNVAYDFNGTLVNASGTYYDTLLSGSGCDSIVVLDLYVRAALGPTVSYSGGDLSTGSFSTYQWMLDGVAISGATSATYTPTEDGDYTVAVSGAFSCLDTSAAFEVTGLKVGSLSLAEFVSIYPNPVQRTLSVSCEACSNPFDVVVYGMDGKSVYTQTSISRSTAIPMQHVAKGMYFISVSSEGSAPVVKKVVKD
jgi:hypothetical protein